MSQPPELDDFDIDLNASDQEDNFELPGKPHNDYNGSAAVSASSQQSRQKSQEDRDAVLRTELQNVKSVNKVIEGVIANLEKAKGNMSTVHDTVHSASTLLSTWTRILSQTEHNQRLILDPNWQGATQDMEDVENEATMRQQAAERRAAEDQARRDAAARRAEDEEQRKTLASSTSTRGARARGRGNTSGRLTATTTSAPGYVGVGGHGGRGRPASRVAGGVGSGIGRGTRGTRGRGLV